MTKKFVLVYQQNGKLRNFFISKSDEQTKSIMEAFYSFPFYHDSYDLDSIPIADQMVKVLGQKELIENGLDDCDFRMSISNDSYYSEMSKQFSISDSIIMNEFEMELKHAHELFPEDLNKCPDCEEGTCDVGPICSEPASNCCGGCYEKRKCKSCDGSGLLNTNL
tara:strand:+ start:9845 stop:10339 length:495 start_codon:yes stop_codon:yes gene_type:complete